MTFCFFILFLLYCKLLLIVIDIDNQL